MALPDLKNPRSKATGPKPAKTGLQKVSLWLMAVGSLFTGGRMGGQALVDHKRDQVVALCQTIQQAEQGVIHTTPFIISGSAYGQNGQIKLTVEVDWQAGKLFNDVAEQDVPLDFFLNPVLPFPQSSYITFRNKTPHDWQKVAVYEAMVDHPNTFTQDKLTRIIQREAPSTTFPWAFEHVFPRPYMVDHLSPLEQPFWDQLSDIVRKGYHTQHIHDEEVFGAMRTKGFILHEIRIKHMEYSHMSPGDHYRFANDIQESRDLNIVIKPDTPPNTP